MDVDQDVSMYGGNSCTATQTRLAALGDLLKAVSEAGVYEVTGSEGSAHTTWFCRLTAWLVTLPSRYDVMCSSAPFIQSWLDVNVFPNCCFSWKFDILRS